LWYCDPPVLGVKLPAETDLRIDGQRVDEILVQLRGKDGEDTTLEFFGAMLLGESAVGTEKT
jgi:hypothetical protein